MSASNERLSLQDFNVPNTQMDMFPSQNDNSSVPDMVEINTDSMDSLRDHQMEYMQEEVKTCERETNSDENVMSLIGSDLVLQTESGTLIHVSVMKSLQSAMSTDSSTKIEGNKDCKIETYGIGCCS